MTASSTGKHAAGGPPADQPPVPEPAFAERARTLLYLGRIGSLSTLSKKQPGFPFGSVMPYGLDDRGRPIFLISTMAMHTQNLQADPRASLLLTQADTDGDPLGASRVTFVGNVLPLQPAEVPAARSLYLQRYENSKYWAINGAKYPPDCFHHPHDTGCFTTYPLDPDNDAIEAD